MDFYLGGNYGECGDMFSKEFMNYIIDPDGEENSLPKKTIPIISVTSDIDRLRTDYNEVLEIKDNGIFKKILMYLHII